MKGGEGTFLFCIKHFFVFGHFKDSLVGNGEISTCLGKEKVDDEKAR